MDNHACDKISVIRHQREKKRKLKTNPCITFNHIHNPVKLVWLLMLITCFNVSNNFTTNNTSNILSEFPCSLMTINHGLNTKKTKNHGSNHKLAMVLFLQIIANLQRGIEIIFFCVYENRPKPTTGFKMI